MNEREKILNLMEFIVPEEWRKTPESKTLMTAYQIVDFGDFKPCREDLITDFENIRVALIFGSINYPSYEEEWDFTTENMKVFLKKNDISKEGAWIIFVQPFRGEDEFITKQKMSSYCAIYTAIFGRSVAYSQEFQHIYHGNNQVSFVGKTMLNPTLEKGITFNREGLEFLKDVTKNIEKMKEEEKERVLLSLHWFDKSIRAMGVDSFLYMWIALEALAMPNTSDIGPMKKKLKKIYEKSKIENFHIGKLFGLRSKIVHDGFIFPIHMDISDYLKAVFVDLLIEETNSSHIYRIEACVNEFAFNLEERLRF